MKERQKSVARRRGSGVRWSTSIAVALRQRHRPRYGRRGKISLRLGVGILHGARIDLNQQIADFYFRSDVDGHLDDRARGFRLDFDDVDRFHCAVRLRAQHDAAPVYWHGFNHDRRIRVLLARTERHDQRNRDTARPPNARCASARDRLLSFFHAIAGSSVTVGHCRSRPMSASSCARAIR